MEGACIFSALEDVLRHIHIFLFIFGKMGDFGGCLIWRGGTEGGWGSGRGDEESRMDDDVG